MSHEFPRKPNLEPTTLSFADIAVVELDPQLNTFDFAGRDELLEILSKEPRPLDVDLCAQKTCENIDAAIPGIVERAKREAASDIRTSYPEQFFEDSDELEPLETHTRYSKRHNLGGVKRQELRTARDTVCTESATRITTNIAENDFHEGYNFTHDDDGLRRKILDQREQTKLQVIEAVEKVKRLLPTQEPDIERPSPTAVYFSDIVGLTNDQPYVDVPEENTEIKQVQSAFYSLKAALLAYKKQNERSIANAVSEEVEPQINARIRQELAQVYNQVALQEARTLNTQLIQAYDKVAQLKTEHTPPAITKQEKIKTRPVLSSNVIRLDEHRPKPESTDHCIETQNLGTVKVPLLWAANNEFDVHLRSQNGNQVLVIDDALSENSRAISREVRERDADSKQFDDIWNRIQGIELTDPYSHHTYISKVRDACNPDYEEFKILYYGNKGRAAKRTYYIKTHAGRFETIQQLAATHKLSEDTQVLIKVCETDKPHQSETYQKEFNISPAQARGVGST